MPAICVYCASVPTIDAAYLDLAAQVGRLIAARGYSLVSGGGRTSMMGAVASAVRMGGSSTVGVIPRSLVDSEIADEASTELHIVETMRERKALMEARADAFLVLPGGLGTMEELFEIWTSRYLLMHRKPVVLLNAFDFYAPLLALVEHLRSAGFVRSEALAALHVVTDASSALDVIEAELISPNRGGRR
jgi:uncharacterized protein (TIGR00730 family)